MAIPHFRGDFVSAGKSPLASAAYNNRTAMTDAHIGKRYTSKSGHDLVHAEIAIPDHSPAWIIRLAETGTPAEQSVALWNRVVKTERQQLAQTARKFIVVLPRELSIEQNIALVRDYVAEELTARGFVVDWVLHVDPSNPGNPHVHIMHTLRPLTEQGFGPKRIALVDERGAPKRDGRNKIVYRQFIGDRGMFVDLRTACASTVTRHPSCAGHDFVLNLRSYKQQGIGLTPTINIGPNGTHRERMGERSTAVDAYEDARSISMIQFERDPGCIVRLVAGQQSVFDERDLARCLHTFVNTEVQFTRAFERAKAHPDLVKIAEPETDGRGQIIAPAKFTTKTMLALEALMSASAERLSGSTWGRRGVRNVEAAIKASPTKLSDEQAAAVRHISLGADLASIVGYAGAGKSTLLRVAADAWCGSGKDVVGGALASKAARGLAEAWGIRSQTLARWITLWRHGQEQLSEHSVFVLDEAGMVGSAQMAAVVAEVVRAGAKLVLVGDPEQLQPIAAGGAFRALVAQCGAFELAGVRRQHDAWARKATVAFQRGQVEEAMQAYVTHGAVQFSDTRLEAAAALVEQYMAALGRLSRSGQPGSQIALAHRNNDILLLNTAIHERRAAAGHLGPDVAVSTTKGERVIARGDRILFLKNADLLSESGEKIRISNSDLGTITAIAGSDNGPLLDVAVDSGKSICFSTADYSDFDFEYATTVHKSQSASLDRVFVFASATMDKSLAYVAMSRHRDDCTVFVPTSELADFKALTWAFSRTAPKATTLDYAEKRGLVPKSAIPRDLELLVKLGRAALAILRQTFERTLTHYRVARIAFEAKIAQRPRADEKSKDVSSRPRRTMDYSPQARARDRAQLKTTNAVNNVVTSFFALVKNKRTGNKALPHQVDAIKSSLQALDDLHPGWARHLKGTLYSDAAFVKSLAGLRPDQVAGAAIKRIE